MQEVKTFTKEWAGRTLKAEVGRYAGHANGSCTLQYGETVVLATACMSAQTRDVDFFPLSVEYEERLYAAGRIKGSRFIKKEGRPTDEAVLAGRFIDRAIRPLFDARVRNEIQVVITVLAFDGQNDPDQLGLIAASAALMISDIPWNGPIAVNRVGQIDGALVLNPTYAQRNESVLDLAVAGTEERVIMVEATGKEASEELTIEAFTFAAKNIKPALDLIVEMQKAVGKKKIDVDMTSHNERATLVASIRPFVVERIEKLFFAAPQASKVERATAKAQLKKEVEAELVARGIESDKIKLVTGGLEEILDSEVTRHILEKDHRVDGRKLDEIRPLFAEVAVLPRVHGSGHFMRGETQVLSVVTLGAPGDEQTLDGMEIVGTRRFMHHYNFPPFSVGEAKPMRGPGRREIGHGALAEKALDPMMPSKEDFPYAIRVVSEVFSSNGSSSMGSACGASLALMDAGVPIKEPVAGIAIGLASTPDMKKWKVITDLQDMEDGGGGMDFKIAGSKNGITAIQLDTKTIGLTHDIIVEAITRGKTARLAILMEMHKAIPAVRADLSPNAPRIVKLMINPEKIREVIGPGGKIINEIIKVTGVSAIDIEDSGLVMITSVNAEAGKQALDWVKMLTAEPEVGTLYDGVVTRVMDFGAFVEIMPKKEGLVHVSEMAPYRVENVSDIVKMGDKVKVKLFEVDSMGRLNLSMKQAPGNVYPDKPASTGAGDHHGNDRPHGDSRPPRKPFVPRH